MRTVIVLLAIIHSKHIIDDANGQKNILKSVTPRPKGRPFYPDPMFSVIEPNMDKHRTAAYGDYRYFDANYEYPIDQDFYRYGITEAPDYNTDPSTLTNFRYTKRDLQQYWNHYKKYYRITFPPAIDSHHYKTFKRNLRNLTLLAKNNPTVNFRINQFMHLTYEEFIGNYTGFNGTFDGSKDAVVESYEVELDKYARQLDWSVHDNAVTLTPKNQNACKNSFLYSAIHNLELKLIIDDSTTTGKDLQYMSLQQGYDCSNPRRTCDSGGGQPHFVFRGLQQSGGIQFDSYMEQELLNNLTCQWHDDHDNKNATKKIAAIQRWGLISVQDEDELKLALNEYGPLSTGIYVSNEIKNYHSGILTDNGCGTNPANHAVLLTGYGTSEEGIPYWILKNSWGGRWGERGYMFLLRNRAACSIGRYLAYAVVKSITTTPAPTTTTTAVTDCDRRVTQCDHDDIDDYHPIHDEQSAHDDSHSIELNTEMYQYG